MSPEWQPVITAALIFFGLAGGAAFVAWKNDALFRDRRK